MFRRIQEEKVETSLERMFRNLTHLAGLDVPQESLRKARIL